MTTQDHREAKTMTEQTYTAEQYEGTANYYNIMGYPETADMLRQAARMMREREQQTFSLSKEFVSRVTNSCEEEPPVIGVGCVDSIKRIVEEMVSACKAERQGDAEFTHDAVDNWARRIMCFADYAPRDPGKAVPDGWLWFTADLSCLCSPTNRNPRAIVGLIRDFDGQKWWNSLPDEERERTALHIYTQAPSFGEAFAIAYREAVLAAAIGDTP